MIITDAKKVCYLTEEKMRMRAQVLFAITLGMFDKECGKKSGATPAVQQGWPYLSEVSGNKGIFM